MDKNDGKFWTKGAENLLEAKQFAYENAICSLTKFYYNFFENKTTFENLKREDFQEICDYFESVIEDFETYKRISGLQYRFEEISKVE